MMAKSHIYENHRVVVELRGSGDFGIASISGVQRRHDEAVRECEHIAEQIRRHVDGLASHRSKGVQVDWDAIPVCEHCGSRWSEDSAEYNGGCCAKDEEAEEARDLLRQSEQEITTGYREEDFA